MKKYFSLSVLTLGISVSAFGSTTYCNESLAAIATNGGCTFSDGSGQSYTINDVTFVGLGLFQGVSSADDITLSATITAGGPVVTLTPDSALTDSGLIGTQTYLFGFDITSNSANINFNNVNLQATSSTSGIVGLAAIAEEDCYGGVLPVPSAPLSLSGSTVACLSSGIGVATPVETSLTGPVDVNLGLPLLDQPTANVDVLKEVQLAALLGSASLSNATQTFGTVNSGSATPEPASFFLGGCGLVVLALVRPRKWKKSSDR